MLSAEASVRSISARERADAPARTTCARAEPSDNRSEEFPIYRVVAAVAYPPPPCRCCVWGITLCIVVHHGFVRDPPPEPIEASTGQTVLVQALVQLVYGVEELLACTDGCGSPAPFGGCARPKDPDQLMVTELEWRRRKEEHPIELTRQERLISRHEALRLLGSKEARQASVVVLGVVRLVQHQERRAPPHAREPVPVDLLACFVQVPSCLLKSAPGHRAAAARNGFAPKNGDQRAPINFTLVLEQMLGDGIVISLRENVFLDKYAVPPAEIGQQQPLDNLGCEPTLALQLHQRCCPFADLLLGLIVHLRAAACQANERQLSPWVGQSTPETTGRHPDDVRPTATRIV